MFGSQDHRHCFFASSTMDFIQHPVAKSSAPAWHMRLKSVLSSCCTNVTPLRSTTTGRPVAERSDSRQHRSSSPTHGPTRRPSTVILVEASELFVVIFSMVRILLLHSSDSGARDQQLVILDEVYLFARHGIRLMLRSDQRIKRWDDEQREQRPDGHTGHQYHTDAVARRRPRSRG